MKKLSKRELYRQAADRANLPISTTGKAVKAALEVLSGFAAKDFSVKGVERRMALLNFLRSCAPKGEK